MVREKLRVPSDSEVTSLAREYADKHPKEIIKLALEQCGGNLGLGFSGAEDVILIELARKVSKDIGVFCLDTGRLHPETYRFIEKVREHYDMEVELLFPDASEVEKLVKSKGLFSFYQDGHQECCTIRKTQPLRRKLGTLNAWITGQRRDQSPGTRGKIDVIEVDQTFSTPDTRLLKYNPLANWSSKQVWEYIRMFDVPYNPLHDKGYISIGCEPCTRPVGPNQHEREGRWWWEESTIKECGLHQANVKSEK